MNITSDHFEDDEDVEKLISDIKNEKMIVFHCMLRCAEGIRIET